MVWNGTLRLMTVSTVKASSRASAWDTVRGKPGRDGQGKARQKLEKERNG